MKKSFSQSWWLLWRIALATTFLASMVGLIAVSTAQPGGNRNGSGEIIATGQLLGKVTPQISRAARDLPLALPSGAGTAVEQQRRVYPRGGAVTPAQDNFAVDPLMGTFAPQAKAQRAFGTPLLNFNGQGFSGVNPSDNVGDIGLAHYVQSINGNAGTPVTIYNKADGTVAAGPFLMHSLASSGACTDGLGDLIILFDQLANRWLFAEFSGAANAMCVYISTTSDPTGTFAAYQFNTPEFPDYLKFGVWDDMYLVTTNESAPAVYAMERAPMLTGAAAQFQRVTAPALAGFPFQALTPNDADGAATSGFQPVLMRHRDDEVHNSGSNNVTQDFIDLFVLGVNWTTPSITLGAPISLAVAEFDSDLCGLVSFSCFGQPGGGTPLDPLREVIMWRLQYRFDGGVEKWLGSYVTDVDGADRGGVRWFEIQFTDSFGLAQEGLISVADDVDRWMSSIAMDGDGNIAVGYNLVDNNDTFPSAAYTGRLAGDAPGLMTQGENVFISGVAANASVRWGDYNSLNVDPVDDCTFWFTSNYSPAAQWATRIVKFQFDSCAGGGGTATSTPTGTLDTPTATPPVETATATLPAETATATLPAETATATEVVAVELVANGGFEPDITGWTLKNDVGDKVKCNTPEKIIAHEGECAFKFKGGAAEATKLQQNIDPAAFTFAVGDNLDLSLFVNAKKVDAAGKVKVVVKYSDSTLPGKIKTNIVQTTGYEELTGTYQLESAAVSGIKVQIKHSSPSGKVFVDAVSLLQSAGTPALLPLP